MHKGKDSDRVAEIISIMIDLNQEVRQICESWGKDMDTSCLGEIEDALGSPYQSSTVLNLMDRIQREEKALKRWLDDVASE